MPDLDAEEKNVENSEDASDDMDDMEQAAPKAMDLATIDKIFAPQGALFAQTRLLKRNATLGATQAQQAALGGTNAQKNTTLNKLQSLRPSRPVEDLMNDYAALNLPASKFAVQQPAPVELPLPAPRFAVQPPKIDPLPSADQPNDADAPSGSSQPIPSVTIQPDSAQPQDCTTQADADVQKPSTPEPSDPESPTATLGSQNGSQAEAAGGTHVESAVTAAQLEANPSLAEKAKLMATWHFAEVTEDGGVAIDFGELQHASSFEHLHDALEELMHMDDMEADDGGDEEAAAVLKGMMQDDSGFGPSFGKLTGITEHPEEDEEETEEEEEEEEKEEEKESAHHEQKEQAQEEQQHQEVQHQDHGEEASEQQQQHEEEQAPAADQQAGAQAAEAPAAEQPPAAAPEVPSPHPESAPSAAAAAPAAPTPAAVPAAAPAAAAPTAPSPEPTQPAAAPPAAAAAAAAAPPKPPPAVTVPTAAAQPPSRGASPAPAAPKPAAAGGKAAGDAPALTAAKSFKEQIGKTIRVGFHSGKLKPLNLVVMVVGTRGDVQPFVGIGLKLKEYGHRVRIASHSVYREFVEGFGLEFYPLGGDPKVLSEFVVKHRGIMPGWDIGDALAQREQVRQILYSTWGSCVEADPKHPNKPFIADAIISNPPVFGHIHCAEKLGVPLHVVFTMPWTPTKAFPQPFARIKTNIDGQNSKARGVMNWMSYFAMEDLSWLGMAGMVKDFRQRVLGLKRWDKTVGSHALFHSKVPVTYIWSPSLVARPPDWPGIIEVVGFVNVELRKLTAYTPPKELKEFLDAGPPPVYIGFGSLVVDDPIKLTDQFLEALQLTGLRAIIQRGWGGLGSAYGKDGKPAPEGVLFIDSAAHDWLFQQCCAVVHHGGAGTTATGLYAGKPTFIVPFFGDQPFWGAAVAAVGAGPQPVAIDYLTTARIVDALKTLMMPKAQRAAQHLAKAMHKEDGISGAVEHIHRTVYSALLTGKGTAWKIRRMAPGGTAPQPPQLGAGDRQSVDGSQQDDTLISRRLPDSAIEELENEEGEGLLRGIMHLPHRLAHSVSSFFMGAASTVRNLPSMHGGAQQRTSSPGSAAAPSPRPAASTPPQQQQKQQAPAAAAATPTASPATAGKSAASQGTPVSPAVSTPSRPPPAPAAPAVVEIESTKRKGFFSFLGC